jgi:carbon monoxide dehydrogenase subunit G
MFPITITLHDPNQLQAVMAALDSLAAINPSEAGSKSEITYPPASANTKNKKVEERIEPTHIPKSSRAQLTPEPRKQQGVEVTVVDFETIADALAELSIRKGRDAAVALLKQFGAERLPEVPQERHGEFAKACKAALG